MDILMKQFFTLTAVSLLAANTAFADASDAKHQDGAILSAADAQKVASLECLAAHAHRDGSEPLPADAGSIIWRNVIPDAA